MSEFTVCTVGIKLLGFTVSYCTTVHQGQHVYFSTRVNLLMLHMLFIVQINIFTQSIFFWSLVQQQMVCYDCLQVCAMCDKDHKAAKIEILKREKLFTSTSK